MTIPLHQAFMQKNLPYLYTLTEVEDTLRSKFKAIEEDPVYVKDLAKDEHADFEHFYKCYIINDPSILQSIFTLDELDIHESMKEDSNSSTNPFQQAWADIQQGRLLRIAIMSSNGENMTSFTQQGISERLLFELLVLKGMNPVNAIPGNPEYERYLEHLHQAGYL